VWKVRVGEVERRVGEVARISSEGTAIGEDDEVGEEGDG
jgi:hypothetical protein